MANLKQSGLGLAVLPPVGGQRPKSFAALYSKSSVDPYQGKYAAIMQRFNPEVNNTAIPVRLFEQAYLCCALRQQQIVIYCLHFPS